MFRLNLIYFNLLLLKFCSVGDFLNTPALPERAVSLKPDAEPPTLMAEAAGRRCRMRWRRLKFPEVSLDSA